MNVCVTITHRYIKLNTHISGESYRLSLNFWLIVQIPGKGLAHFCFNCHKKDKYMLFLFIIHIYIYFLVPVEAAVYNNVINIILIYGDRLDGYIRYLVLSVIEI